MEVLASPREIWAGAVAVNEMCVKKGMSGAAYSLGESRFILHSFSTISAEGGEYAGFEGRVQLRLGP